LRRNAIRLFFRQWPCLNAWADGTKHGPFPKVEAAVRDGWPNLRDAVIAIYLHHLSHIIFEAASWPFRAMNLVDGFLMNTHGGRR